MEESISPIFFHNFYVYLLQSSMLQYSLLNKPNSKNQNNPHSIKTPISLLNPNLTHHYIQIMLAEQPAQQSAEQEAEIQSSFHIAFGQRKKINLERLKSFMKGRETSVAERYRIYTLLQSLFREKIQYTKSFIKDFIKYFEDLLSLYASYYKSISKLDLHKKPKDHFVYQIFERVILELSELSDGEVERLKVMTNWVEKILLPSFKAIFDKYKDQTKEENKAMDSLHSAFDSHYEKQLKFYTKINENTDLLESQIILIEKICASDESLIAWGAKIFKTWQVLLQHQGQLREQLQKNIIQFQDKFTRVYNETQASKSLLKFWMELPQVSSWHKTFTSIFTEKDLQFINFGFASNSLKANFQPFIHLKNQTKRVGDPIKLIQILQNKKFKCKLQKSQREYIDLKIYFTVDKNILLYDQIKKKVLLKIIEKGLAIKRISQNLIELVGIQPGFLIDSKKTSVIHFGTMDQAEQFMFFVENLLKEQK